MSDEIQALIGKAGESIDVAELLLGRGNYGFSVSRSYYAFFYVAEALLLSRGLSFSKHSAVIAGFAKHFVKTGLLDKRFHAYLRDAFDARQVADYDAVEKVSEITAKTTLDRAEEFLAVARGLLKE